MRENLANLACVISHLSFQISQLPVPIIGITIVIVTIIVISCWSNSIVVFALADVMIVRIWAKAGHRRDEICGNGGSICYPILLWQLVT